MRSQEVPKIMTPRVFEELHKMPNITTWMTLTGAISNSLDIKDPWNIEKMEGHTYESKIASELGEPSRSGRGAYYGAKGFMDMNNSTHFRTTQHSPWYHYVLPFIFGWPQKTIVDHNMLD